MKPNTKISGNAIGSVRPVVLLVGGTDPSGGAGLAADLKSVSALGGHGCLAVTAVTVQNSGGVSSWMPIPPATISAQMETTCDDGDPGAVKTGMLGGRGAVEAVAEVLRRRLTGVPYILDPVLVAGSGDGLAENSLQDPIRDELLPLALLATPNLDEAEALTGLQVRNRNQMERAAAELRGMGAANVLLKGGHLQGEPADLLATEDELIWFPGKRIVPGKVHGTGCTLASSCSVLIAAGYHPATAVEKALAYLRGAIAGHFSRKLGILPGHFPPMGPLPGGRDGTSFYKPPRFCPACSGELAVSKPHPVCSRCGLVFYRNPLPAVILVLQKEDRILVARRAMPPALGEWCLPGGFIDLGESPEEAASRELKEETLLTGGELTLLGADRDTTDYGGVALYIYRVMNWQGEPSPADDVSELEWMKLEEVPPLAFPAHDRVIESLRRKGYER